MGDFTTIKKISLIVLLGVFSIFHAFATTNQLVINSLKEANEEINDYIFILKDTGQGYSIEQMLDADVNDLFVPLENFSDQYSQGDAYWLRLSFKNNLANYHETGLKFHIRNHQVKVFTVTPTNMYFKKTGLFQHSRDNDEILHFTNIISLPDDKRVTCYIKLENINDLEPVKTLQLVNTREETNSRVSYLALHGFMQGLFWFMIVYGVFMLFFLKSRVYFYYTIYVFLVAIWMLGHFGLLFSIFPNAPRVLFLFLNGDPLWLAFFFYLIFAKQFVNLSEGMPKMSRFLYIMQSLVLMFFIFNVAYTAITMNQVLLLLTDKIGPIILISVFSIFVVRLFITREKYAIILALGTSMILIGMYVSSILGFFDIDFSAMTPMKVGAVLEVIIFTFGLSYQFKRSQMEKQKTQEKLIIQMNKTAEIQQKVNLELEEKVKERTREIEKQNEEISTQRDEIEIQRDYVMKQKEEIMDSIHYARFIQSAVLPEEETISEALPGNFVYWQPKNIVSGDFYWFKEIKNHVIIVAADCTGHGVPGAFMSMLGVSFLNEIVTKSRFDSAAEILDRLRKKVKTALNQKGDLKESKDGMDMALCILDKEYNLMQFAGAFNPLLIVRENKGNPEIEEIKADRQPISIFFKEKAFTNHEIKLQKGDCFYLFSDGYIDQFGGEEGDKFKMKRFKEMLVSIHDKDMKEQKKVVEATMKKWLGLSDRYAKTYDQLDDILVVGVKV